MGAFFRRLGTFLGALVGGVLGVILIFPLGLVVSGWVIIPLTMAMAALLTNGASSGSTVTKLAERTNMFLSETFRSL